MQWRDDAIVLGTRRHGETSLVLEVMTRERGRSLGLVKGGRSPRYAAKLQPGNGLDVTWRARLDEHLGNFAVEPMTLRASSLMETALGLNAVQTLASHLRLLPERDPHPELYDAMVQVLDHIHAPDESDALEPVVVGGLIVRFELLILDALGFGLDLDECALTGATEDLAYVSPRTGRAASRAAGLPWQDKLIALPAFLNEGTSDHAPDASDVHAGFRLTGHFFQLHVWGPRGLSVPLTREALVSGLKQQAS
jgi:DNA repair protein RecO (recombination protein O)